MNYNIEKPKVNYPSGLTGKLPAHFDPTILPDPTTGFILGLVGSRGCGKSALLYNILTKFYKGCFDRVYIFNPSYGNDPTLSPESLGLPEESFLTNIDTDFIEQILQEQIDEKRDYDKQPVGKRKKKNLSRILFVFDDCISDPSFSSNRNTNVMNALGFRGRHYRINTIITSQFLGAISRRLRCNIPNWMLFNTDNGKEIKILREEMGGTCNEDAFERMYRQATAEPYNFFMIYGTCPNKEMKFRRNLDNILEYNYQK